MSDNDLPSHARRVARRLNTLDPDRKRETAPTAVNRPSNRAYPSHRSPNHAPAPGHQLPCSPVGARVQPRRGERGIGSRDRRRKCRNGGCRMAGRARRGRHPVCARPARTTAGNARMDQGAGPFPAKPARTASISSGLMVCMLITPALTPDCSNNLAASSDS